MCNSPTASPITTAARPIPLGDQIQQALADADGPQTVDELRRVCRVRTSTLCDELAGLAAQGRVKKAGRGYALAR